MFSKEIYKQIKSENEKQDTVTLGNCHLYFLQTVLGHIWENENSEIADLINNDLYSCEFLFFIFQCLAGDLRNNVDDILDEYSIEDKSSSGFLNEEVERIIAHLKATLLSLYNDRIDCNELSLKEVFDNRCYTYGEKIASGDVPGVRSLFSDIAIKSVLYESLFAFYDGTKSPPVLEKAYLLLQVDSYFKHLYPLIHSYYVRCICDEYIDNG